MIVNADKTRITQVIFNLLSNAIKFSPENGGLVSVSSEIKSDNRKGGQAIVSVIDNGPGIDSDFFPSSFQGLLQTLFQEQVLGYSYQKTLLWSMVARFGAKIIGMKEALPFRLVFH